MWKKKQAQDGYKARPMNLNSVELLLNFLETPDGKCLFLSLSAMKTQARSLNTGFRMFRCVLGHCRCVHMLMPD